MGVFNPKHKSKKRKMNKDALSELNSSNVSTTAHRTDVGTNSAMDGSMFSTTLLVQLLLPLILATLILGRKWIYTRICHHLDKSYISLVCPSISKRERLIRWTEQLSSNRGIQDTQLHNLWLDGRHLCILINNVVPGACANPHRHWQRPPAHAQALAYKYLGIVPVFTDDDFQTKIMTSILKQLFQNYLTELQIEISKISQEQQELNPSHSNNYVARGMGLTTGEQHRKNYLYIYPTASNHRYDDVIISMKGPYNTYESVILNNMNQLNSKFTDAPYKSSVGKQIHQQCESMKKNQRSFLRSLSIDLTNIMSTEVVKKHVNPFDFHIKIEKGRAKVAFISKNSGIHELCVTSNGEHISGSPFNINIERNTSGVLDCFQEIADKHVYKTINRKVIEREIDFITEKAVSSNLHNFAIMGEFSVSVPIETPQTESKKKLIKQEKLSSDKEEIDKHDAIIDVVNDELNKTNDTDVEVVPHRLLENVVSDSESLSNVDVQLEMLMENDKFLNQINLAQDNACLNCSSDLSNIDLEELEDTDLSEPISIESTEKYSIFQKSNNKTTTMVSEHLSKLNSNHSIYCSSEFSTNSIELEELQDIDLSSDEFLYFGQNIFPQEHNIAEMSTSPKSNISIKDRIAYYNKYPKEIEEYTNKNPTVDIPETMECFTYEPDILTCHIVKYSEITNYTSPIWKHIVQEENPNQNITLLKTSSETDQETNVLNASIASLDIANNKVFYSSVDNNNSLANIRDFHQNDFEEPQSYYNKSIENFFDVFRKRKQFWDRNSIENSSDYSTNSSLSNPIVSSYSFSNNKQPSSEKSIDTSRNFHRSLDCLQSPQITIDEHKSSEGFSEMFRKRRQFWHRKSVENSSGCSSNSSLCNPIVSSYSFYNNRRLSSEKSIDTSRNFHRSLDCFQSPKSTTDEHTAFDDLCKSTDDLAFLSVKERKLLFIKEMNNHWTKGNTCPVKATYCNNKKLTIREKDKQEVKKMEKLPPKALVLEKIKLFDQDKNPKLQNNKEILSSKSNDFVQLETKKLQKPETIPSNNENFKKAQSYFKTLENEKNHKSTEFHINHISRRHSIDCENKIKRWEASIKAGNLTLPRVSEKFPLDNIYKDVLGDRKNTTHLKGSANKVRMIVTLHSMPEQSSKGLSVESEFKEELFFGQKKFKDRLKSNSVFPVHY